MSGQSKPCIMEYGIRVSESGKRGSFRIKDDAGSMTLAVNAFRKIAPVLENRPKDEPTFDVMKNLPEVTEFISHFREIRLHFELVAKAENGAVRENAVLIVGDDLRPFAAMRWAKGEGMPFFYHCLSEKQMGLDAILSSIPV